MNVTADASFAVAEVFLYRGVFSDIKFIHSTLNWPIVKSEQLKIEYFRFDI